MLGLRTPKGNSYRLDGHKDIVTHCHKGVRSMRGLEILKAAGFSKVWSLRGRIDAWAEEIEPGIARY